MTQGTPRGPVSEQHALGAAPNPVLTEPPCVFCRDDVDLLREDFVILGDARVTGEDQRWRFAHAECLPNAEHSDAGPTAGGSAEHGNEPLTLRVDAASYRQFREAEHVRRSRLDMASVFVAGAVLGAVAMRLFVG